MLLSADAFNEVVESLGANPALAGSWAGDQRREPRVVLDRRVTLVPYDESMDGSYGAPLSAPLRDLSRGGFRLLLPYRMPLDTPFVALLPRRPGYDGSGEPRGGARPLAVQCVVTYWQPIARDLFAVGGQFLKVLTGTDLPNGSPEVLLPDFTGGKAGVAELLAQRAAC